MIQEQSKQPAQNFLYVTVHHCLCMMAVGLPFIIGGLIGCLVFRRFDLWLILMTVGYGADMPLAWGWILIRVLRGEKLINPITLPIDNRLCDVELTVEKIRFGVQIAVLLALLTLTRNTPIKKSDLPFCFFAGSVLLVVLFHRALQLQRQLRAWKAVGGKIGMPARQRQGYGTTEIEEGQ